MTTTASLAPSQLDTRRNAILRDQHGRRWFAQIEKRSGFPCGIIVLQTKTPGNKAAPWEPEQGYFRFNEEDPTRFRIDYEAMLTDRRRAHDEYHQRAVEYAAARDWPIPVKGEKYDPRLVQIVGKPPLPWQPVAAAMQGNSWILGLTDTVDERVAPFVRKKTREEALLEGIPDFSDVASVASAAFDDNEDEGGESEAEIAARVEAMRAEGRKRDEKGKFVPASAEA